MKEAQQRFDQRKEGLQSNIDSLRISYEKLLSQYQSDLTKLSTKEKQTRLNLLQHQRKNIVSYSNNLNKVVKEEEEKMLQGVLNQVNSYAHQYAEDNGYKLVLGTTLSGSILYGEPAIDITKPLLEIMNEAYYN